MTHVEWLPHHDHVITAIVADIWTRTYHSCRSSLTENVDKTSPKESHMKIRSFHWSNNGNTSWAVHQCSHPLVAWTCRATWMDPPLPINNGTPTMLFLAGMEFTENVLSSPMARSPLSSYAMRQRNNFVTAWESLHKIEYKPQPLIRSNPIHL